MNKNNSNSKNRELAYNGIGSGGGGGGSLKIIEYTGTGEVENSHITMDRSNHFICGITGEQSDAFVSTDSFMNVGGAYNDMVNHWSSRETGAYISRGKCQIQWEDATKTLKVTANNANDALNADGVPYKVYYI